MLSYISDPSAPHGVRRDEVTPEPDPAMTEHRVRGPVVLTVGGQPRGGPSAGPRTEASR